ncbi:mitochondrial coenzyme A diphosphatase NUDT8 [Odontesthes bonariensis]|uniref:mitochondrial coenzyme A diphosphatase NUDT8 n=1 Tax=Odontesthes bonariensis TaxID=219752 RepID=UPI003F587E41
MSPIPLTRMFRAPQTSTWSCSLRSLLLSRESHLSAFFEHTGSGWQGARHAKERKYEQISRKGTSKDELLLSTKTVSYSTPLSSFSSNCDNHQLSDAFSENLLCKAISLSHHHHPKVSAKTKQVSNPLSIFWHCLINRTLLERWRRPLEFSQPPFSCIDKTQYNLLQSHLYHIRHSASPFSLSAHKPGILNKFNWKPLPHSHSFHQARDVHQAAPYVADTLRDCLSPKNENRCRQRLGPNWKLYETDKVRKGASQTQGKNQGRWASILVCLCTVEGDPAFLFTLRSSTLKGRHKGDVSFAGGKSDPSDRDVVATALREAREELGVDVANERVWGVMKPQRDMSGMMIAPVLANLGPLEDLTFKPNPEEVEEIFTVSLSHLCNPLNRGYTHFRTGDKYGYTLPVFCNGKHRVWGLTAVALDHTLKIIVPPE